MLFISYSSPDTINVFLNCRNYSQMKIKVLNNLMLLKVLFVNITIQYIFFLWQIFTTLTVYIQILDLCISFAYWYHFLDDNCLLNIWMYYGQQKLLATHKNIQYQVSGYKAGCGCKVIPRHTVPKESKFSMKISTSVHTQRNSARLQNSHHYYFVFCIRK